MKIQYWIALTWLFVGCKAFSHQTLATPTPLLKAERLMASGQYYSARQLLQDFLAKNPDHVGAQQMMADVLNAEITRQKEVFEPNLVEEFSPQERATQAKIWFERAQGLLKARHYDDALSAAEKVFTYDPQNTGASKLIDEVKKQGYREGKREKLVLTQEYQDEENERMESYRNEARQFMKEGRLGMAKVALEKILLLNPDNPEAQKLYDEIQAREDTTVS